ncbi:GNAT family N-acetyltransferase [Massilia varians]|nr:GNAT family N-acetyltransferase [Massilia varians]
MQNRSRRAILKKADSLSPEELQTWQELSTTQPHLASPFMSAHYARAVAEAGLDARVCIVRDEDQISAFFPHSYASGLASMFGVAERIGGEMTDTFGVVAHSGFRTSPEELLRLAKINYLNFSHLAESQLHYGLAASQPRVGLRTRVDPQAVPVLNSVPSIGKHYLKESARRTRKLTEEVGPLRFEFNVEGNRTEALELLIRQKRAQYRSSGAPDSLKESWKRNTLSRLLDYRFDSCQGVLSSLYAGDAWIASHFGIMGNGILHMWFPVYNQEFSKYSPGRLLLHAIIESSRAAGFDTVDRGEGDTPIKREIANQEYQLYRGIWQSRSALTPIVHNFTRLRWRLGF